MVSPKEYTEEEVNQMLANQELKLRITGVENILNGLNTSIVKHMHDEEREMETLMGAIEQSSDDRRKAESEIAKKADERHEAYHRMFVKRKDLYIAVGLLIAGFSAAAALIAYDSAQRTTKAQESSKEYIIDQVGKIIDEKMK